MEERKEIVRRFKQKGLSISKAVRLANMSRSSFYYKPCLGTPGRKPSTHTGMVTGNIVSNEEIVNIIKELLQLDFVDYGYKKVTYWLNLLGFYISDDKVYRLMKENALLMTPLKKSPNRTFVKYTLALPQRPYELLEMDIKFIYVHDTGQNALLLSVLDTFNRKVLAWKCSYSIRKADVLQLIDQLIIEHLQPNDLLNKDITVTVRSDNGSQFIAKMVKQSLRDNFIIQEFTRPATPQQNAHIESFHSIVKRLVQVKFEFDSLKHLNQVLSAFFDFYNNRRIHSSICYLFPELFDWAYNKGYVKVSSTETKPHKRFSIILPPASLAELYYFDNFAKSSQAETGSAGEQPARNSLMNWKNQGGEDSSPIFNRFFRFYMPKKTRVI
jgi:putative transposase